MAAMAVARSAAERSPSPAWRPSLTPHSASSAPRSGKKATDGARTCDPRPRRPVLGICRGLQVVQVAFGGRLIQHIPELVNPADESHFLSAGQDSTHAVTWRPKLPMAAVLEGQAAACNSSHHQAADPSALGRGLADAAPHVRVHGQEVGLHQELPLGGFRYGRLDEAEVGTAGQAHRSARQRRFDGSG